MRSEREEGKGGNEKDVVGERMREERRVGEERTRRERRKEGKEKGSWGKGQLGEIEEKGS